MARTRHILIFGESPLVEEYALVCHNKGYQVGVRLNPGSAGSPLPRGLRKVTRATGSADLMLELTNTSIEQKRRNLAEFDKAVARKGVVISSSVTVTAAEQAGWMMHPGRLVGLGALPSLLEGGIIELAPSHATETEALNRSGEFVTSIGKSAEIVQDSVGLVLPRILCALANEAYFALGENVATGADIDTAMKLGTNYPRGPIEWAERIGTRHVRAVLDALYGSFGEDRYRVSPLLRNLSLRSG
jgi:3-hydroxybutyryl-CoA dehydrogenase